MEQPDQTTLSITQVVKSVNEGKLALPEFQRDFEWKPRAVAEFMRTVLRGWPAGSLLLLKTDGELELEMKPIRLAPLPSTPQHYVLDGQQRLTALFHVFAGEGDTTYYLDLRTALEAGDFEDEHLGFMRRDRFERRYPSTEAMAEGGVLPLSKLRDDVDFGRWCDFHAEDPRTRYREFRATALPGLANFQLPATVLGRDTPLQAIAKIFETINTTGVKLGLIDLMTAKLYSSGFRLKNEIADALRSHSLLETFGIDGSEVLKLIALQTYFRQQAARQAHIDHGGSAATAPEIKVKGVRESDVLRLDAPTVLEAWPRAVDALADAVSFLRQRCGVIRPSLLPAGALLLPLADALSETAGRSGFHEDLVRWFWCSGLQQSYSQGANTQAVKDSRQLRAWRLAGDAVPDVVRQFAEVGVEAMRESMNDSRSRNESLLRTILALSVARGARDWSTHDQLKDLASSEELEVHHIYPDEFLKQRGVEVRDRIVNLCLIKGTTNSSLRDMPPSVVTGRDDFIGGSFETHSCRVPTFADDGYETFWAERIADLESRVREAVEG